MFFAYRPNIFRKIPGMQENPGPEAKKIEMFTISMVKESQNKEKLTHQIYITMKNRVHQVYITRVRNGMSDFSVRAMRCCPELLCLFCIVRA